VRNPQLVARAYENAPDAAVAVWNPTDTPQELAVAWPGRRMVGVDLPGEPSSAGAPPALLPAGEVAVMHFAAATRGR